MCKVFLSHMLSVSVCKLVDQLALSLSLYLYLFLFLSLCLSPSVYLPLSQLIGLKNCYVMITIQFNIIHLFSQLNGNIGFVSE